MARKRKKKNKLPYLQWQRWYAVVHLPDRDTRYKVLRIYTQSDADYYYRNKRLFPTLQEAEHHAFSLNTPIICNFT